MERLLFLKTNLFTVGTVLLPACTGTAVPSTPPFLATPGRNRGKSTATPLRRPEFFYCVGVETPRQLAPFARARFRLVCRPRTDDSARAGR